MLAFRLIAACALFVAASHLSGRSATAQVKRDYTKLDVCQLIPGDAIARALGAKLSDTHGTTDKSFSRCRYTMIPAGSEEPRATLASLA